MKHRPVELRALANKRAELHILDRIGAGFFTEGVTSQGLKDQLDGFGDVNAIDVFINSPGGNVFDGIAIYNMLKDHPASITVHVIGLAASIASTIAMAADEGRLLMADNALMMIHDPMTGLDGNAEEHRATADVLDTVKSAISVSFEQRTGLSKQEVSDLMSAETWMTAEQAREKGFADALTAKTQEAEAIKNFDLTIFRNAAKVLTPKPAASGAEEEEAMNPTPAAAPAAEAIEAARREGAAQAQAAEKSRRTDIRAMFQPFEAQRELLDTCLEDPTITAEAASARLLEALGKNHTPTAGLSVTRIEAGIDARDKIVAGTSNAILAQFGHEKVETGNEFAGMRLGSLIRASLRRAGRNDCANLEGRALAEKFFAIGMLTGSDFPLSLAATANKVLRKFYETIPLTWKEWAAQGSVSDFKSNSMVALGSFPDLLEIPEGGEYKAGAFSEEAETMKAKTKGRQLILSRQAIINDDLGVFVKRAGFMGAAAARTVNNDVYKLLTSQSGTGPTMADGGAYFNATAETSAGGHANLTSSGTAITAASIGVGAAAMGKHKDKDGNVILGIAPKKLLVPVTQQQVAWTLLNSTNDPAATNPNTPNYARKFALDLVSDPYLDTISTTAWYLFADPAIAPGFEVDFLDGNDTPYTDEAVDWDTDAIKYKIRLDYGVAAIEWRSGYKNAGA